MTSRPVIVPCTKCFSMHSRCRRAGPPFYRFLMVSWNHFAARRGTLSIFAPAGFPFYRKPAYSLARYFKSES